MLGDVAGLLYDLLVWAAVVVAGLLVWALAAAVVGVVIGRVVRYRDQQVPHNRGGRG